MVNLGSRRPDCRMIYCCKVFFVSIPVSDGLDGVSDGRSFLDHNLFRHKAALWSVARRKKAYSRRHVIPKPAASESSQSLPTSSLSHVETSPPSLLAFLGIHGLGNAL